MRVYGIIYFLLGFLFLRGYFTAFDLQLPVLSDKIFNKQMSEFKDILLHCIITALDILQNQNEECIVIYVFFLLSV